jgi:hypothetical protein
MLVAVSVISYNFGSFRVVTTAAIERLASSEGSVACAVTGLAMLVAVSVLSVVITEIWATATA